MRKNILIENNNILENVVNKKQLIKKKTKLQIFSVLFWVSNFQATYSDTINHWEISSQLKINSWETWEKVNRVLKLDYSWEKDNYIWYGLWVERLQNDDYKIQASLKLLNASRTLWTYIWIQAWSNFEKFLIQEWIQLNNWKLQVWISLLKKLQELYFSEVNKTYTEKMTQKAVWIEYIKAIEGLEFLKEMTTAIVYYDVWDVKLWTIWDIIENTDDYYDWTRVYWWIKWWSKLLIESWLLFELNKDLSLDFNIWLEQTKYNELYNQDKQTNLSAKVGLNLTYVPDEDSTFDLWFTANNSYQSYYGKYSQNITDDIDWYIEWRYTDNSKLWLKNDKLWILWLRYKFWDNTSQKWLDLSWLKLSDLKTISWLNTDIVEVKEKIVYKDHLVYIDKTALPWTSYLEKNQDWTLLAVNLDMWVSNLINIDSINYAEHLQYFTIKDWKYIHITDFEKLYAPATYNIMVKDSLGSITVYWLETKKGSVVLDISPMVSIELSTKIIKAIQNDELAAEIVQWLLLPQSSNLYLEQETVEKIIDWEIPDDKVQNYLDRKAGWDSLNNYDSNFEQWSNTEINNIESWQRWII